MIEIKLFCLWFLFFIWAMLISLDRKVGSPSGRNFFVMFCPIIHIWFCIKFTKWKNLKNLKNIFDEDYLFED